MFYDSELDQNINFITHETAGGKKLNIKRDVRWILLRSSSNFVICLSPSGVLLVRKVLLHKLKQITFLIAHQSSEQLLTMISLRSAFDIVFDEMKKL